MISTQNLHRHYSKIKVKRSQWQQLYVQKDTDNKINTYMFKLKQHYDSFVPKQRKCQANNIFFPNFLYKVSAQIFFQQTENKTDVTIPGGQQGVSFSVFQAKYCVFQILKRVSLDIYVFFKNGIFNRISREISIAFCCTQELRKHLKQNGFKVHLGNGGERSV